MTSRLKSNKSKSNRLKNQLLCFGLALLTCLTLTLKATAQATTPITFKVLNAPIAPVSDRLFGHLLERASWGEPGPEIALTPGTRQIQPEAIALMHRMNIPIMRFPGGTDVDYTNWQDLISNVPNRDIGRPLTTGHSQQVITNDFGLDEYFQLRDELSQGKRETAASPAKQKVETILVANFLDAAAGKVPVQQVAQNAAGLVAYANAPLGAKLPANMVDWPAIRAKNGHPAPYGAEYLQIGNELWSSKFIEEVRQNKGLSTTEEMADWYLTCLKIYIAAIDAVDPNIKLIVDGLMGKDAEQTVLADLEIRDRIEYVAFHNYAPGPISEVTTEGNPVNKSELSSADWWKAWVAMPGIHEASAGVNIAEGDRLQFAKSLGYKIAITEWNWNGWDFGNIELDSEVDWRLASGLGAAGYLHGLMRQGNEIDLACQSLLIGAHWNITSIRVDADQKDPPYFWPQGQMTAFYSRNHGSQLLEVEANNVPHYKQPFKVGWSNTPRGDIATIDLVATADEQAVYVHAINRALSQTLPVEIDLSGIPGLDTASTQYLFAARQSQSWMKSLLSKIKTLGRDRPQEIAEISSQTQTLTDNKLAVKLPKQSVSIFKINKTKINKA